MIPPPKPSALIPLFENIPPELKEYDQFVVWRFDWNAKRGDWAKVPYSPKTKKPARTHNATGKTYPGPASETWGSFEEARACCERGGFDGIGFVFTESDPFIGGDIDHCVDDSGALNEAATFALPFISTYCEISPSGTGVKFIACASMPGGKGRKNGNVELYPNGRYFTLTGHRLPEYPASVEERQGHINTLHEIWFGKELPKLPVRTLAPITEASDYDVLKRAERDPLFDRLWRGDFSGYSSQSVADTVLAHKLLFYIGEPDTDRVDRLFRSSGLMREKWDERRGTLTYGEMTIRKAAEKQTDYHNQQYSVRYAAAAAANDLAKTGASLPPTYDTLSEDKSDRESIEATDNSDESPCDEWGDLPPNWEEIDAPEFALSDEEESPVSSAKNEPQKNVDTPPKNEIENSRQNHSPRVSENSDLLELCPSFDDIEKWKAEGRKLKRYKIKTEEEIRWRLGAWCDSLKVQYGGKQAFIELLFGKPYAKTIMGTYAPTFRAWRGLGRQEGVPFSIHQDLQGVKDDTEKLRWCSEYRERAVEASRTKDKSKRLTREEIRERLNIETPKRPPTGWAAVKAKNYSEKTAKQLAAIAEMMGEVEADHRLAQFVNELYNSLLPKEESTYGAAEDGIDRSGTELCDLARDHIENVYRQASIEEGRQLSEIEEEIESWNELEPPDESLEKNQHIYTQDHNTLISEDSPVSSSPPSLRFSPAVIPPEEPIPDELSETFAPFQSVIDAARSGKLPRGKIAITSYMTTDNFAGAVQRAIERKDTTSLQLYQTVWEQQADSVPMLC